MSVFQSSQGAVSQQALLTEAMLQRHNETESSALRPSFTGKHITVNNRYPNSPTAPTACSCSLLATYEVSLY